MYRFIFALSLLASPAMAQAPSVSEFETQFESLATSGLALENLDIAAQAELDAGLYGTTLVLEVNGNGEYYLPGEILHEKQIIVPMINEAPIAYSVEALSRWENEEWVHEFYPVEDSSTQLLVAWRQNGKPLEEWPSTVLQKDTPAYQDWVAQVQREQETYFQSFPFSVSGEALCSDTTWRWTADFASNKARLGALTGTISLENQTDGNIISWVGDGFLDDTQTLVFEKTNPAQESALTAAANPTAFQFQHSNDLWIGNTTQRSRHQCTMSMYPAQTADENIKIDRDNRAAFLDFVAQTQGLSTCTSLLSPVALEQRSPTAFRLTSPSLSQPINLSGDMNTLSFDHARMSVDSIRMPQNSGKIEMPSFPITIATGDCPIVLHNAESMAEVIAPFSESAQAFLSKLEIDKAIPVQLTGSNDRTQWGTPFFTATQINDLVVTGTLSGVTRSSWTGPHTLTVDFTNPLAITYQGIQSTRRACAGTAIAKPDTLVFMPTENGCPTLEIAIPQ